MKSYDKDKCAVFFKVGEKWGEFSNINHKFPFQIFAVDSSGNFLFSEDFASSEILYQALKFKDIENQRKIASIKNSIGAKKTAYSTKGTREDWNERKLDAMRFSLFYKFSSNLELIKILVSSGDAPIVEKSFKDVYWGAKPLDNGNLVGQNNLGELLMEMRESVVSTKSFSSFLEPLSKEFKEWEFLGHRIERYLS